MAIHTTKLCYSAKAKAEAMIGRAISMGLQVEPYGSRTLRKSWLVSNGSDWDFLVDAKDKEFAAKFKNQLKNNGFDEDGSRLTSTKEFFSLKKELDGQIVNFIVLWNEDTYNQLLAANELVAKHSIIDKEARIALAEHFTGTTEMSAERFEVLIG
jgi:hypothetical protein